MHWFPLYSISGPSATIYPYLGEFNSIRNRDAVITFTSTFAGLSSVIVPALGWYLLPQTWALEIYEGFFFRPWRLQLILHTLPGLLAALLVSLLPESPKFLVSQVKSAKQLPYLLYYRNINLSLLTLRRGSYWPSSTNLLFQKYPLRIGGDKMITHFLKMLFTEQITQRTKNFIYINLLNLTNICQSYSKEKSSNMNKVCY